jgi:hypothetical protein
MQSPIHPPEQPDSLCVDKVVSVMQSHRRPPELKKLRTLCFANWAYI